MGAPLAGIRVVELAGIGPGPHAAMLLADLGADVLRVERPGAPMDQLASHVLRRRTVVTANLKDPDDRRKILSLITEADVLLEGFRPGVAERLGLGPLDAAALNERLIYARLTGWGQDGPYAHMAGHDINYISITGALHAVGPADQPVPPLNLFGDFGGGSMFAVVGVLAALYERTHSGQGQIVDAAMVNGVTVLAQHILEMRATGVWTDERAANLLDGHAPFYRTYKCKDGRFVAVGALEPQFFARLVSLLELDAAFVPHQADETKWGAMGDMFASAFSARTRDEWTRVFDGTDACVTPVLTFEEAPDHPHMAARAALRRGPAGIVAAEAPLFSRTYPKPEAYSCEISVDQALQRWCGDPAGDTLP